MTSPSWLLHQNISDCQVKLREQNNEHLNDCKFEAISEIFPDLSLTLIRAAEDSKLPRQCSHLQDFWTFFFFFAPLFPAPTHSRCHLPSRSIPLHYQTLSVLHLNNSNLCHSRHIKIPPPGPGHTHRQNLPLLL